MNGFASSWSPFHQAMTSSPSTTIDSVTNVSSHHLPPCHHQAPDTTCPTCHVCHWQNCHRSFVSVEDLLAHVSTAHLGLGADVRSSSSSSSMVTTPQHMPAALDVSVPELDFGSVHALACLWDDCLPPIPAATTTAAVDAVSSAAQPPVLSPVQHGHAMDSATLVLRHLLEQHIGVQATKDMLDLASLSMPSATLPTSAPSTRTLPASSSVTPTPSSRRDSAQSVADPIDFICRWQDCGHVCEDAKSLTDHVSLAHVGNGKPEYFCLWQGCGCEHSHHPGRLFTSRQKIMRHLQTHTGEPTRHWSRQERADNCNGQATAHLSARYAIKRFPSRLR